MLAAVRSYVEAMRSFAAMTNLEVWYSHLAVDTVLPEIKAQTTPKRAKLLDKAIAKMKTRDSMQAFTKLTEEIDGQPRIVSQPPLVVPLEQLLQGEELAGMNDRLSAILRSYQKTLLTDRRHLLQEFRLVEVARKVVGVGSVGTRAWIALLLGRDNADPLLLQVKEAEESVVERFAGKSAYPNHGQRVVAGQRLMQATSDIFLGWDRVTTVDGQQRDFYFRQLRDWKGSVEDRLVAAGRTRDLCTTVRLDPGPRPRPVRRPDRRSGRTWASRMRSLKRSRSSPSATRNQNDRDFQG